LAKRSFGNLEHFSLKIKYLLTKILASNLKKESPN